MTILLYKTEFLHMPMFSHQVVPDVTWSKSSSGSILHIHYMYTNNGDIVVVTGVGSCHFLEEIFDLGSARPVPPLNL